MKFTAIQNSHLIIPTVLGTLVLGPATFAFHQALYALPYSMRMACTALFVVIFIVAGWFMRQPIRQMGVVRYWLFGAALLLGLGLCISPEIKVQSADFAKIQYSNGEETEGVKPTTVSAWDRTFSGYFMHPAYGTAVVPNSLVATFLSQPKKVNLLFAKPQSALFQDDGKPTESDGISVELSAFDSEGNLGYTDTLMISQESFLKDRWIEQAIQMDAGIALIKVTLGQGPIGSTPNYDSTIVGLQVSDWHAYAEFIGIVMLVCMGFFVLALFLVLNVSSVTTGPVARRQAASPQVFFYCALVFVCLMLLAYWSESKTSYVFFWDFRNYWEKTETLYELIKAGSLRQAINMFSSTYTSDYSMLPSVLPALSSLITGYPTRLNYSLSITALYAVPAYIMVAYLAKRLVDGEGSAVTPLRDRWVLASFPIFFGLPIYFGTTLYLMPDIGGVILFVGALLSASALLDAIREQEKQTQPWHVSKKLFLYSINLGVLFSLMFIFRRWYVFAATGIACSLFALVLIEILRSRASSQVVSRTVVSAALMAFAALPLLCWVLFDWSRDFGRHDYSNLYASYQDSLGHDVQLFKQAFGVIAPLLCIVGGVFLYRLGKAKHLFFLLIASTCIASLLFLYVQSPGRHHFFLLMPLLGALLAGLFILVGRHFGLIATVCLALLLVIGGTLATRPVNEKYGITIFAGFDDWLPQHQKYSGGYTEMSEWLALPENEHKKFCLIASSVEINQGIFSELWQTIPSVAKHAYDQRLLLLGQIDSINGPPAPSIKQCQIFLVGVPFQTHLRSNQQFALEIIQKDMVNGTGIGKAVERSPKVFAMGDTIEVRAYKTERDITNEEYADLVKRFLDSKGFGYSNPAPNQ
ncbi:hypothetical protein H0A66_14245 [Alcaligenaceae bacterium]|nr:hypothetical protein [Alcaligenaceae bacterium]